jgi:hypothetical protein
MMSFVVAGDYSGWQVGAGFKGMFLKSGFKKVKVDKDTIESYELVNDEHSKSASSGIIRGGVGGALLGPVGALGGALSAKEKGVYRVSVQFKDGKRSLLKIDQTLYNILMQQMF